MALIQIDRNPSPSHLRQFAGIWLPLFCALVGGLLWWKAHIYFAAGFVWGVGAVTMIVGLIRPAAVRWVYLGWMYAAFPIGWTISHLVLAAVYYGLITPVGLVLRLFGHDPMQRKFDPSAKSYWSDYPATTDVRRYFRQF